MHLNPLSFEFYRQSFYSMHFICSPRTHNYARIAYSIPKLSLKITPHLFIHLGNTVLTSDFILYHNNSFHQVLKPIVDTIELIIRLILLNSDNLIDGFVQHIDRSDPGGSNKMFYYSQYCYCNNNSWNDLHTSCDLQE